MRNYGGVVLDIAFRTMVPFALVYGIYILTHGEFSPGGGFQAGALLAIGFVMARIIDGQAASFNIRGEAALIFAGLGVAIYAGVGFYSMLAGGQFLDYSLLPISAHTVAEVRVTGILFIEIGVVLAVAMTILNILDAIMERVEEGDIDECD